ncbi:uncharacterized protein L969DRAFT_92677 [Mixia osmundae IAM 14324]|uniref:Zn(2)-C6 fungal-type domain-containing protein n=1 Tax=Mixia osmundae (strain CBS 9802 / IAM 14324 / JCM 22182 / KY 12970) TaxID=764103 RepID=G7DY86_MIXOS|nr:uncharacterized protein L969DRAFT_92677 [Mixia osmundae IAM 14324]KEI41449.1 hypothetical protein L969DRAFT_92677 [Mixia osmundae IAM 14324]GAA95546.1 hypothetical protein E5Q_02201 [Mixia osmundae IAM 14324]
MSAWSSDWRKKERRSVECKSARRSQPSSISTPYNTLYTIMLSSPDGSNSGTALSNIQTCEPRRMSSRKRKSISYRSSDGDGELDTDGEGEYEDDNEEDDDDDSNTIHQRRASQTGSIKRRQSTGHAVNDVDDAYFVDHRNFRASSESKRRRNRKAMSCEGCRKKKTKCDRCLPCASCRARGEPCIWKSAEPQCVATEVAPTQAEHSRLLRVVEHLASRLGLSETELRALERSCSTNKPEGARMDQRRRSGTGASLFDQHHSGTLDLSRGLPKTRSSSCLSNFSDSKAARPSLSPQTSTSPPPYARQMSTSLPSATAGFPLLDLRAQNVIWPDQVKDLGMSRFLTMGQAVPIAPTMLPIAPGGPPFAGSQMSAFDTETIIPPAEPAPFVLPSLIATTMPGYRQSAMFAQVDWSFRTPRDMLTTRDFAGQRPRTPAIKQEPQETLSPSGLSVTAPADSLSPARAFSLEQTHRKSEYNSTGSVLDGSASPFGEIAYFNNDESSGSSMTPGDEPGMLEPMLSAYSFPRL